MFVPGLVAFVVYRLAKLLLPLSEPFVLLAVSGLVSLVTALLAYRVGRATAWGKIVREDGGRLLLWLGGWIGFVYGVQLSLLVLALLWLVGYDYLKHPDGPAMMAIIIACTSVARDAFEIGHVRKMALHGPSISDVSRWGGSPHDGGQSCDGIWSLGRSRSRRRRIGPVAGALCRGESSGGIDPVVRCGGVGGRGRALCLFWWASSTDVMDPRASADEGGRIAQILVVAWTLLRRDVLSRGGRMCDFPLETAWNFHFLCHGRAADS